LLQTVWKVIALAAMVVWNVVTVEAGGIEQVVTVGWDVVTVGWKVIAIVVTVWGILLVRDEVSRDVLIIDSFNVPKQLEEAGFTPDVVANQVFNTMREINDDAHAQIEKNEVTSARDVGPIPDVEVPGTKLGLKTLAEIARSIPGVHHATHVTGDIVAVQTDGRSSVRSQITVTIYVKGKQGSPPIRFVPKETDIDSLTREIAEKIWEQVQPFVLATYRSEHREREEALKLARRIIAEKPPKNNQVAASYALVGKILSYKHDYKEAEANFKISIDRNPKSAFPHIVWGNAFALQANDSPNHDEAEKDYNEAIEQYSEAIAINPKSPVPYNSWGNMLRDRNNDHEANAKYQQAIKNDPRFVPAYNNLGWLFYRQKKCPQAIEQYQRANAIDPRQANHKQWGRVLLDNKQYDEAIVQCQKAVDLDPKAVNGYNCLGKALTHQKKYGEAIEQYNKAIAIDKDNADYNGLGDALAAEQKYDEAIEQYKKAIAIDPQNADAYDGLGNALSKQGKRKAAEEMFTKARESRLMTGIAAQGCD
jgi:tetratricopeptide (TPR) repeat protein